MENGGGNTDERSTDWVMVNPVVLIATHKRWEITCANIDSLLAQSVMPRIVLVVSLASEMCRYKEKYNYPNIDIVGADNEPIGAKWQAGVIEAYGANPLIITGSDDILGPGFIENACRKIQDGYHFVGLRRWWIHHRGKAFLCDYMIDQPLGGGRIYSRQMLEFLEYKLFDITKERHLDDYAWGKIRESDLNFVNITEVEKENLQIHAVKGNWAMMNRFDLRHPNLKKIRVAHSHKVLCLPKSFTERI